MKKLLSLSLAILLALSLAACAGGDEETTTTEPVTITEPATTTLLTETNPAFDYMELFNRLEGCWNNSGRDMGDWLMFGFVGFVYYNNRPCVIFGLYEGESTGYIEVTDGYSTGENKAALTIFFPAQPEDAMYPGPERTETVHIDMTGLEDSGKIDVKRETSFGGDWITYTYGGKTIDEARAKAHEAEIG